MYIGITSNEVEDKLRLTDEEAKEIIKKECSVKALWS